MKTAENFVLWGAVAVFFIFLCFVLAAKLASGKDCQARINKTHFLFFIPYAATALAFLAFNGRLNADILPALSAGGFIYFSLNYIYLQALIGLAKKSVSVNILESIVNAGLRSPESGAVTAARLLEREKEKIRYIREDRLRQMLMLGMAARDRNIYRLTARGRFLNRLGGAILKAWNLKRP